MLLDEFSDVPDWLRRSRLRSGSEVPPLRRSRIAERPRASSLELATHRAIPPEVIAAARERLTTGTCKPAFGSQIPSPTQTCEFRNLYSEGSDLVAHVLQNPEDPNSPGPFPSLDTRMRVMSHPNDDWVLPLREVVRVKRHRNPNMFAAYLRNRSVEESTGVTLAFTPVWHFNIGHALFDGLYPAFVSLIQWGRQASNWHSLLMEGMKDDEPDIYRKEVEEHVPGAFARNEEVLGTIGRGKVARLWELSDMRRYDTLVLGIGVNGAQLDQNGNFTLGAARGLNATWWLRQRMYDAMGLEPRRRSQDSHRRPMRGIIIHNKRFGTGEEEPPWVASVIEQAAAHGVELRYVRWSQPVSGTNGDLPDTGVGGSRFMQHLAIVSQADLHISAPGTAMFYQSFLRDGSVHINLGEGGRTHVPWYMEEYLAEASPYIRALYYWPGASDAGMIDVRRLSSLVLEASQLIEQDFAVPVPVGANLSPLAQVMKAYMHLTLDREEARQLTPLRSTRWSPNNRTYRVSCVGNHYPHESLVPGGPLSNYGECPFNSCLIRGLMEDYGEPCSGCSWTSV